MTPTLRGVLPGLDERMVVDRLTSAAMSFTNVTAAGGTPHQRWARYMSVAAGQAETLAAVLRPTAVESILFGRGYDRLLAAYPAITSLRDADDHATAALGRLVDTDIGRVAAALLDLAAAIRKARERLRGRNELCLVPDTNVLVSRPGRPREETLATLPWLDLLDPDLYVRPPDTIRVLLPLLVFDEVDNLKRNGPNRPVKEAAREVLRDLNRRLAGHDHEQPVVLDSGDLATGRPVVALDLLFEPPGHHRLPRPDDEIVQVARDQHSLRGRPIDLMSCDLNFATRARRFETRGSDQTELRVHLIRSSYDPAPA